jgi:hypothetical protein
MAWQLLRSVVEELDVSEYVDLYTEKYPRFDEMWEGIKWILARNPLLQGSAWRENGSREYRVYVFAGDPLIRLPEVWVAYRYDEAEVAILGINAVPIWTEDEAPTDPEPD